MSQNIENRVVEMQFDNRQFESGVQTTLSTLDKLKASLNFGNSAAKGFSTLQKAASTVNLSGLQNSVDAVNQHFSLMGIAAIRILDRIATRAINAGERIVKSLTVDPITTGLSEYETKMNAIQVIKSNTRGKNTMSEITDALDELNKYADDTIYNFSQMTSNMGKFVAQGLDAKQAANAIQGIANLAGASGASAQDMARATYQMSQALGGVIRKMDWNSLRNANMATTQLKDTLIAVAKIEGNYDVQKVMKAEKKSFEDTLEKGWLTGDLFTKAMEIYSGTYAKGLDEATLKLKGYTAEQIEEFKALSKEAEDATRSVKTWTQFLDTLREDAQSTWTQSWEYIIGDFEEAKKLWTDARAIISQWIADSAEARNNMLSLWHDMGGRKDLFDGIYQSVKAVAKIFGTAKEGFASAFNPIGADTIYEYTKRFKMWTDTLKPTEGVLHKIRKIFKGLGSAVHIVLYPFIELGRAFGDITEGGRGLAYTILQTTARFMSYITAIDESMKHTRPFRDVVYSVADVLKSMAGAAKRAWTVFAKKNGIATSLPTLQEFKEWLEDTQVALKPFTDALAHLRDAMITFFDGIANTPLAEDGVEWLRAVNDEAPELDESATLIDYIGVALHKLGDAMGWVKNGIGDIALSLIEDLGECFDMLSDKTKALDGGENFNFFIALGDAIWTIGSSVAKFGGAIFDFFKNLGSAIESTFGIELSPNSVFSMLNGGLMTVVLVKLRDLLDGWTGFNPKGMFDDIKKTMTALSPGSIKSDIVKVFGAATDALTALQNKLKSDTLWSLAKSIGLIAASMVALSMVNAEKLGQALTGIVMAMGGLYLLTTLLPKLNLKQFLSIGAISKAMIRLSVAILILAVAMKVVGEMKSEDIAKGLVAIAALALIIGLLAKIIKPKMFSSIKTIGKAMISFAAAIWILAHAIVPLAKLKADGLLRATLALGAILLMVGLFTRIVKSGAKIKNGLGMIFIATAVLILGQVVENLSDIKTEPLKRGVLAVGALLLLVGLFSKMKPKGLIRAGIGMTIMAGAMLLFAAAVNVLGGTDDMKLIKGLASIGYILLVLSAAMLLLPKNMPVIGIGLVIVAAAINMITGALERISAIPYDSLSNGLLAFIAMLIALAAASKVMKGTLGAAASLLVMAAAMAILAPVMKTLSTIGFEQLGTALLALAGIFTVFGIAAMVLEPLAPTMLLLAAALTVLGIGVIALSAGLLLLGPALTSAGGGMTLFVSEFMLSIGAIIAGIAGLGVELIAGLAAIIAALCGAIVECAPDIAMAIGVTIAALAVALMQYGTILVVAVLELIVNLLKVLNAYIPEIISQLIGLIVSVLYGVAQGIRENRDLIVDAIAEIIAAIGALIFGFIQKIADSIPVVGGMIKGWLGDMESDVQESVDSSKLPEQGEKLGTDLRNSVAKPLSESAKPLTETTISTLKDGLLSGKGEVGLAGEEVGKAAGNGVLDGALSELSGGGTNAFGDMLKGAFGEGGAEVADFSKALGVDVGDGFGLGLESSADGINATGENVVDGMFKAMRAEADAHSPSVRGIELGSDVDEGIAQGLTDNKSMIDEAINGLFDGLELSIHGLYDDFKLEGMSLMTWLNAGMNKNRKKVEDTLNKLLSNLKKAVETEKKKYKPFGSAFMTQLGTGISVKRDAVKSSLGKVLRPLPRAVRDYYSSFKSAGSYLMSGLAAGIEQNKYYPVSSTRAVAKEAYKAATKELDIQSPSKAFEYIGKQNDLGFARGTLKNMDVVTSATEKVMDEALATTVVLLSAIGGLLDENLDYNPKITPVLDLSQIQNGAKSINGLMGNRTYSLAGRSYVDGRRQMDNVNSALYGMVDAQNSGSPDVVAELASLRGDISKLEDSIMHMQVVLSTGVLVGQMDKGLGINATRKMRGN